MEVFSGGIVEWRYSDLTLETKWVVIRRSEHFWPIAFCSTIAVIAKLAFNTAWELANRDERIKVDKS